MNIFNHLLACLALCLFAAGCGEDEPTNPNETHDHAEFIFFHADPGTASVDLRVDGTNTLSDRTFSIINNDYAELEAGARQIAVVAHADGAQLAAKSFSFIKDEHYTLFLADNPAGTSDLLRFHDNLTEPAAGKAHVRIAHLIPDGPTVKLAIPGSGKGPILNNVKFMDTTETFTPLDAGQTTFRVQDVAASGGGGGGGGGGGAAGLFDDFTVSLEEGKIYTIVLVGKVADATAEAILVEHKHD